MDHEKRLRVTLADCYQIECEIGGVGVQLTSVSEFEVRGETPGRIRRPSVEPDMVPWPSINETCGVEEIPQ